MNTGDEHLEAAVEAAPIPMLVSRRSDGLILYHNRHVIDVLGIHPDELKRADYQAFYYEPDDRSVLIEMLEREGFVRDFEVRARHADGSHRWVVCGIRTVTYGGEPALTVGFFDITERRRLEAALRQSESRVRGSLDKLIESCQIIDFDYRFLYVNEAAQTRGLLSLERIFGRTIMEVMPAIVNTDYFACVKECLERRVPHRLEREHTFPDDSKGWFDVSIQPVPEGAFVLALDITERKRMEEALERTRSDLLTKVDVQVLRQNPTDRLTVRELMVLNRMATGETDKQIAFLLGIGQQTVQTHVSRILSKMHAGTRTEASVIAVRKGLIS